MKLEDRVIAIIRANIEAAREVTLASDLRKELHLDSFGTLMVLNAIEDTFGLSVNEAHFNQVHTVQDVVALLRTQYHCA
jgi:acyl carrier protein